MTVAHATPNALICEISTLIQSSTGSVKPSRAYDQEGALSRQNTPCPRVVAEHPSATISLFSPRSQRTLRDYASGTHNSYHYSNEGEREVANDSWMNRIRGDRSAARFETGAVAMNERSKSTFARRARAAKLRTRECEFRDDTTSSLGLTVRPSGVRTFLLFRRRRIIDVGAIPESW